MTDTSQELANALQSAHPKIQKMCEEESDDSEAVAKLLEINDSIHRTIERYKLMKAGDVLAAQRIPKGTLGTTTGVGKNAANELSLIDLDPEPSSGPSQSSNGDLLGSSEDAPSTASVEDDLLGLSISDRPLGLTGSIALGSGPSGSWSQDPFASIQQAPGANIPPPTASPPPTSSKPNYEAFTSLVSPPASSKPSTPFPVPQPSKSTTTPPHAIDPFASLVSAGSRSNSRPSTPSQRLNGLKGPVGSSALVDVGQANKAAKGPSNADEEWDFASALPEASLPSVNNIQVHMSHIKIMFRAERLGGAEPIHIMAQFSNLAVEKVTGLHFQVAVQRAYHLKLQPQSGRDMAPVQKNGIQQEIVVTDVPAGSGNSINMRFKVSYLRDGVPHEEQGIVPPLGIA